MVMMEDLIVEEKKEAIKVIPIKKHSKSKRDKSNGRNDPVNENNYSSSKLLNR